MNLLAIAMWEGMTSLYAGVVSLPLQIPVPDLDQREWLRIAFVVVFLLATALALLILAQRQRNRHRRTCRLEIANLGNVPSRYELQAEGPAGGVRFTFVLGKTKLKQLVEPSPPAKVALAAPPSSASPAPGPGKVRQTKDGAMRTGGLMADILYTLGSLLPRSLGTPLTRTASQIRRGQTQVRRVERLQGQASRLQPTRPSPGQASTAVPSSASQTATLPSETVVPTPVVPDAGTPGWVQTPAVEPGGTLVLHLLVDPVDPFQTQHYPFVVRSRSLEQPEGPPVVQKGSVQIVKPTFVQRFGPYLAVLSIATITLLVVLAVQL